MFVFYYRILFLIVIWLGKQAAKLIKLKGCKLMKIGRFIKSEADKVHGGTLLASDFLPKGVKAPFGSAWGYMECNSEMELDQHPTKEVYVIIEGTGTMIIDEESEVVGVGDVIAIPPNAKHKLITGEESSILFAALWWKQAD